MLSGTERVVLDASAARPVHAAARRLSSRCSSSDLKGLLAYSTISHLGLITLLLGLNSPLAAVAAVFHIMNHATFKASLFMAAGIIDHETGTRDIRRLSGLFSVMPITAHAGDGGQRRDGRRAAAQRLPVEGDVLREAVYTPGLPARQRRPASPPWPAPSPWPTRCASSTRLLRPAACGPAAPAARAAALDARAGRAAGAGLPGGRRRAGSSIGPCLHVAALPVVGAGRPSTAWRSGTASTCRW